MGSIGGILGLSGGASGTGFSGPVGTAITPGTNAEQLQTAYGGAQNSLEAQKALLAALQAQNGIGNQSQVYNQFQGVVNGTGPNPAQAMLNQATGANVANQAALMAGQRGASSNAGLMARQAAQAGSGIQQNAAGQAATLQANQSLNALGAAGNMANQQVANQMGATTANTQAQQSEQQILQNANAQANNANVAMQGNINSGNAGLAQTGMQGQQGFIGGLMNGAGAALGLADGGEVPKMADGGILSPQSTMGRFLQGWSGDGADMSPAPQVQMPGAPPNHAAESMKGGGGGGKKLMASGGSVGAALKSGGGVPGKAKVSGNSYSNDTVKALLSPGEVVIPRSVMQSGDPINGAAKFVAAVMAKKKSGK